jgi:glycosyltransferase involved in cell wall biosynthesis
LTTVIHVQKVSGISGSEGHLLSLLPLLRKRGWDARMLVLHQGEAGAAEFCDRLRAGGVPTEAQRMRLDLAPSVPLRLLRAPKPMIVHTHLIHADVLALPAAAVRRVPVRVSTKHGFNEFRENRAVAAADRAAGRFAHRQIAISAGLAAYLTETQGYPAGTFTVVHYGIDAGPEPSPPPASTRLVAVGRLIRIKGFDILLQAFAIARRELPDLTLELAGAGPLEQELRATAPEGVTFLGRVSPIEPCYERNAIVVVPSPARDCRRRANGHRGSFRRRQRARVGDRRAQRSSRARPRARRGGAPPRARPILDDRSRRRRGGRLRGGARATR